MELRPGPGEMREDRTDRLCHIFFDSSLQQTSEGRNALFAKDDNELSPLSKIVCFTEHPSLIRRGGVITTIKYVSCISYRFSEDLESHPF